EMRSLLPGVAMQRSNHYVQNTFGPFGYATGRSASGDTCLYAWQRLASKPSLIGNKGSVQIRLRLCGRSATEESLLATMYGFTFTGAFADMGWNPFDRAPPSDPRLGVSGQPMRPDGTSGLVKQIHPPPSTVRPPAPRGTPPPPSAPQPMEEPI